MTHLGRERETKISDAIFFLTENDKSSKKRKRKEILLFHFSLLFHSLIFSLLHRIHFLSAFFHFSKVFKKVLKVTKRRFAQIYFDHLSIMSNSAFFFLLLCLNKVFCSKERERTFVENGNLSVLLRIRSQRCITHIEKAITVG